MGNHFGEYGVSWMPKRAARPGPPAVGQRVYLGGYITGVGEDTSGFQSVIIKLDKFESPSPSTGPTKTATASPHRTS